MNMEKADYPVARDEKAVELDNSSEEHGVRNEEHEAPTHAIWTIREKIALFSLCVLWVGSQLPLYFMGATLSYVSEELGGKAIIAASWIPVSNTLALASVCPFSGYLQDLFGRRNITMIGAVVIIVGTIIVATAHTFTQAIVGMAIAGAGAGVGELAALSGVAELVPVKKRGLFFGLVVITLAPTTPYVLYGQMFSTRTAQGWRWGQWISLIYNGLALIGIALTYFPERYATLSQTPPSRMETLKKIDYLGGFLSIVGLTLFLVALQSGGFTHEWKSAYVLCTLLIGLALIFAFVIWEWKGAKVPIVPKALFEGQKIVAVSFFISFIAGMNFYSLINFFPLSFSTLYNPDPVQIGLKGLGYGISVTLGAASVNVLLSIFKKNNRELILMSCVIMTAFIGALAAVTPDTPKLNVALGTIGGFGVGGVLVPINAIAVTACPDSLIGTAVALALCIRVIGGSIGYTIYFNIFSTKLETALPAYIAEAAIGAGLPATEAITFVTTFVGAPTMITSVPGVTPQIIAAAMRAAQEAYAYGLKYVWLSSIAFGVVAIIACFFLPSNHKFLTNRVAAHIRN